MGIPLRASRGAIPDRLAARRYGSVGPAYTTRGDSAPSSSPKRPPSVRRTVGAVMRSEPWRYGPIYGGRTYSERQILRKVRLLLATQVWDLQLRISTYSRSSTPRSGTQEAQDRSVHPLGHLPYRLVTYGLNSAIDHLVGLRGLLSTRRSVPAYSAYTLIRASLEGSLGAWRLLSAPTREEAFVEALARWKKDEKHSVRALELAMGTEGSREWASIRSLLERLGTDDIAGSYDEAVAWTTNEAQRLGWLRPGQKIPPPASTTSDFEALNPDDPGFGRHVYSLLSGGAHGQPWAAEALAWPRRDLKPGRVYLRTVEPKMPFIHRYTEMAVNWAFLASPGRCTCGWCHWRRVMTSTNRADLSRSRSCTLTASILWSPRPPPCGRWRWAHASACGVPVGRPAVQAVRRRAAAAEERRLSR